MTAEVHLGGTRWRYIALPVEGDTLTEHGSMWLIFIFRVWTGAPLISTVWLFLFQNTAPLTAHNILYNKKKKNSITSMSTAGLNYITYCFFITLPIFCYLISSAAGLGVKLGHKKRRKKCRSFPGLVQSKCSKMLSERHPL